MTLDTENRCKPSIEPLKQSINDSMGNLNDMLVPSVGNWNFLRLNSQTDKHMPWNRWQLICLGINSHRTMKVDSKKHIKREN